MARLRLTPALLLLAGCGGGQDGDAAARRSTATPRAVHHAAPLQTIALADIERWNLFGAGCAFLTGDGEEPLVIVERARGAIKRDGRIVRLMPDRSSPRLPLNSYARYVGAYDTVELRRRDGAAGATDFAATLVHRAVGAAPTTRAGRVSCGA